MQAQLADLYVEPLQIERIWQDVIKEAPVKLSAAVVLAKDSQGIWGKVKGKKAQEWSWKVGRREGRRRTPTWNRKVKHEEVELGEWKEVPNECGHRGMGFINPCQAG